MLSSTAIKNNTVFNFFNGNFFFLSYSSTLITSSFLFSFSLLLLLFKNTRCANLFFNFLVVVWNKPLLRKKFNSTNSKNKIFFRFSKILLKVNSSIINFFLTPNYIFFKNQTGANLAKNFNDKLVYLRKNYLKDSLLYKNFKFLNELDEEHVLDNLELFNFNEFFFIFFNIKNLFINILSFNFFVSFFSSFFFFNNLMFFKNNLCAINAVFYVNNLSKVNFSNFSYRTFRNPMIKKKILLLNNFLL